MADLNPHRRIRTKEWPTVYLKYFFNEALDNLNFSRNNNSKLSSYQKQNFQKFISLIAEQLLNILEMGL